MGVQRERKPVLGAALGVALGPLGRAPGPRGAPGPPDQAALLSKAVCRVELG